MSFINYSSREINCKIVYYGPGLCGKTTNLQHIYQKTNPDVKGKMISLATETERTLFFDFLPLALGEIRGFKTRFHLYTGARPGLLRRQPQAHPEGRRRRRLRRRQPDRAHGGEPREPRQPQGESQRAGLRPRQDSLRHAVQQAGSPECRALSKSCRSSAIRLGVPEFEACASTGEGVFETLKAVAKLVLADLKKMGS